MRRENEPVSTTLDVGLNNNPVEREGHSSAGSEDTENENFWVTDGVGISANYEWCWESGSSVDDPEESLSDYGLGSEEDNRPNNWKNEASKQISSEWKNTTGTISREKEIINETSNNIEHFWNNTETRDDNEFNNNETVLHPIAGDCVNQLDICKNEEKTFYEKPKLNIQTVTYLYDSVLPPKVKCMNYVNSIKVTGSLENLLTPEERIEKPEILEIENIDETEKTDDVETGNEISKVTPEIIGDKSTVCDASKENEIEIDVEIVELKKSVAEVIQFPEIEEITETARSTESSNDSIQLEEGDSSTIIDHIDLIREAKELTIEQKTHISDEKITLDFAEVSVKDTDSETLSCNNEGHCEESPYAKIEEIDLLSSIGRDIGVDLEKYVQPVPDVVAMETVKQGTRSLPNLLKDTKIRTDTNKLMDYEMPDVSNADTRKKEKMARNQARRRQASHSMSGQPRRPDKRRVDHIVDGGPGGFDVYNIETAMPKIDLDAIETHLRAAREEERRENERVAEVVEAVAAGHNLQSNNPEKEDLLARFNRLLEGDTNVSYQRRNDREEIRRRLAMGPDAEDLRAERGRKPSLQSRLQSGMNLQICFMNETPSDTESPSSENDRSPAPVGLSSYSKLQQHQNTHQLASRPQVLSLPPLRTEIGTTSSSSSTAPLDEADFFARQARLQTEARMALAQAKEMAHMQMEVERQRLKQSPITEMVRSSLEKVGVQLGEDRRRLSRVLLTELNVAQLQVVANDLHARIATLNEALVEGLLRRDDLHMEQDSMLVDVEDLTRYLGAKQETLKKSPSTRETQQQQQNAPTTSKNRGYQGAIMAKTSLTRDRMIKCLSTRRAA